MWSPGPVALAGAGPAGSSRAGESSCRTRRTLSTPQHRTRNWLRSRGAGARGLGRRGAVGQFAAQVLVLQHLPDLLHAPVLDEELEPVAGALGAVAVVAEQAGHAVPDVGGLVGADERAQALRQLRVGG